MANVSSLVSLPTCFGHPCTHFVSSITATYLTSFSWGTAPGDTPWHPTCTPLTFYVRYLVHTFYSRRNRSKKVIFVFWRGQTCTNKLRSRLVPLPIPSVWARLLSSAVCVTWSAPLTILRCLLYHCTQRGHGRSYRSDRRCSGMSSLFIWLLPAVTLRIPLTISAQYWGWGCPTLTQVHTIAY